MDCVFCKIINGELPCRKVYEDDLIIGIMDIEPFCDGHVLLIPKKHYVDMMELDSDVLKHINEVAKELTPLIMNSLNKESMTLSYNYGVKQVVKHFHMHMLPNIDYGVKSTIEENYKKIIDRESK